MASVPADLAMHHGRVRGPGLNLVGRDHELDTIRSFIAARPPSPSALLLEGPAGIGKTSLWQAGLADASRSSYVVLSCQPAATEIHLLYGGLTDLLLKHVEPVLHRLPEPQRRAVEIVLLLGGAGDESADERALAAGVLGLIRELAADTPLLLGIDDVQWLDPASALVIEYALRRLPEAPVSVLAAARWDPLAAATPVGAATPPRLDLRRALGKDPLRVRVGPLSSGALHEILRQRTGRPIPRPLLRRIQEASGGNPFYALEIARAMDGRWDAWDAGEPLPLPVALGDLVTGRFSRLPIATREALYLAAATSQPTPGLIETLMGGGPVESILQPALDAGIVAAVTPRIEFAHPLLAAAAEATMTNADRRRWDERLAQTAPDPEARARHLARIRPGRDPAVADLLHQAGQDAQRRGSPETAGELFAAAIDRLPEGDLERRPSWTLEAAALLRQTGDLRRARTLLEPLVDELSSGPQRSDVLLALSRLVEDDPGGGAREPELIDRALEDAGTDPGRRAAALLRREMWERHRDRFDRALPIAREALPLAEQSGDRALLAGTLTRIADLEVLQGIAPDPVERFRAAIDAGSGLDLDSSADSAQSMLAACLIRMGRVAEARTLLLGERERVRAVGDEASLEMVCVLLTELEWLAGDWDRALAYAEEGRLVASQAESRLLEGALTALIALVHASRGDVELARTAALEAVSRCEEVGDRSYAAYARQILGFLELSVGQPATAVDEFAIYLARPAIEGTKRLAFVGDQIEALVLIGRVDEAELLVGELAARGQQLHRPTLTAAAARGSAYVRGAKGDLHDARNSAERAVALTAELGLPFEHARAQLALGDAQRRAKQWRAARETLTSAKAGFAALGARPWESKASDALGRVGGRTREEGLTATERQVATLVAQGLTNKEVAAELFVSVRAVEANLSRIYEKLNVRSRTELAKRL
jgi:DNA-binding CsgD family transcriptional regulator